jgi:hypothetical protein
MAAITRSSRTVLRSHGHPPQIAGRGLPAVAAQAVRQYTYLYGAISPRDGLGAYLILPDMDTVCMQMFLTHGQRQSSIRSAASSHPD